MNTHQKLRFFSGFLALLTVGFLSPFFAWAGQDAGFLSRTISFEGVTRKYQVYVPDDWTPEKKWPVILFLNGAGERGSDGVAQTTSGLGPAIKAHPNRFPAVVVFPQCPNGVYWTSPGMTDLAMKTLKKEIAEFNGDPKRIYLTGISMGGYGAWMLAAQHPGFFAALTPISSGVNSPPAIPDIPPSIVADAGSDPYALLAAQIGTTPTWVFHSVDDPLIPVSEARQIAEAFKGHPSFHYTELDLHLGHLAWLSAYDNKEWATWLFQQKKDENSDQ